MKLDKRIVEGRKYLDIFDTKEAQEYIGQKCYFSDKIARFSDLDDPKLVKATLTHVKADDCEYCYGSNEIGLADWYYARYILPLAWVKEPKNKYRAYTLKEFIGDMSLGLGPWIRMRPAGTNKESKFLYTGYQETEVGEYICLGCFQFDFVSLFQNYEICINGEWQPFGIKE